MAVNRWAVLLVCTVLPTLPACLTGRSQHTAGPVDSISASPVSEFASDYPRAPGERVAKQDLVGPTLASAVANSQPAVLPKVEPPTPPLQKVPSDLPGDLTATALPPDPPLVSAIRAYLNGQPKLALEYFKSLDKSNQDLLLRLVPVVVQASQEDLSRASPNEIGSLVEQLDKAVEDLSPRASLYIEKACFCDDIKNFGRYKPLPEGTVFRPGAIVQLYIELRNVPSEPTIDPIEGPGFLTRLVCSLEMCDSTGKAIEIEMTDNSRKRVSKLQIEKNDFTRSRLKDYFIMTWFGTPSRPGRYTVTFAVQDPKTGRAVSTPMSFRVQ